MLDVEVELDAVSPAHLQGTARPRRDHAGLGARPFGIAPSVAGLLVGVGHLLGDADDLGLIIMEGLDAEEPTLLDGRATELVGGGRIADDDAVQALGR